MFDQSRRPSHVALHEAMHACIARELKLPVVRCALLPGGAGVTETVYSLGPSGLFDQATAAAAGVWIDRVCRAPEHHHFGDLAAIDSLASRYRELTGEDMPDPLARVQQIARDGFLLGRPIQWVAAEL